MKRPATRFPPSTGNTTLVMKSEAREARKIAAPPSQEYRTITVMTSQPFSSTTYAPTCLVA
jgi:hypothetical protein